MSDATRCAALVGPYLSGKTTLLESLLFMAGALHRKGSVKDGSSVGDPSEEARARQMSTEMNVASMSYLGDDWALVDCPGSVELMQDTLNAIEVADIGVVVVEPAEGRLPALFPLFRALGARGVPHMVFINKVDAMSASVVDLVSALREVACAPLLLREYPVVSGESVTGYVDLISRRAYSYVEGQESAETGFPDDIADEIELARTEMLETVADFDDTILEKLLEDELPDVDEVYSKVGGALRDGHLVPVYFGSAERNFGIRRVLKALRHDTPGPERRAAALGLGGGGDAVVQVFKTLHAQHSGKVSVGRVWRGEVSDGQTLAGARVGGLQRLFGGQPGKLAKAGPGDVVGLGRMDPVRTGDTLAASADGPDGSGWPAPLAPVYSLAITPADRGDEVKLSGALQRLNEEDPSLVHAQNDETHELVLGGQGDIHLRVALDRLASRYGVSAASAAPSVSYRETIQKPVTQKGRFKRQTGGHGMFGDVTVDIAPRARGEGFAFSDRIVGGAIPKQYIPAVEAGVREHAAEGPLGFPVVDFAVTLTDGQFHSVDSNEMSFKLAARAAMAEGLPKCSPVLLEPVARVTIDVPSEHANKVHGLVSGKRGQILGLEAKDGWRGWDSLHSYLPESEILDLIVELRSLTQGVGTFSAEFDHLQELAGRLADEVVERRASRRREERAH